MFDQKQRVAQLPELGQRSKQPAIVARMQSDRRLVEHVEHAAQAAAHLRGQPDPLHLAAGERRRRSSERQILQSHVDQELQPVADFADQLAGNLLLHLVRPPAAEIVQEQIQRPPADLVDRAAA